MPSRFRLCFALLGLAATSHAADELPPTRKPDAAAQRSIETAFHIQALRDTRDPTLVEVMIQVDHPPVPMAFDVSLHLGNKVLAVGPMVWNQDIKWWAYDVDIPVGTKSIDVVFTANPAAVGRLQRIDPFAVRGLTTIWDGTAMVKDAQIREQTLSGMISRMPPKPELLPQIFADELAGQSDVVARFRQDLDVAAARTALEKLLQQNPKDATAQYNLGCLAAAEAHWQRAIECFAQARNAAPDSSLADQAQHQLRQVGGYVAFAAQREEVPAMFALATMYDRAWGPARDLQTAKRWYRNAATAGHAPAMTRLGALYADDLQNARDPKAQAWYRDEMLAMYQQGAQLNDPEAKAWLAQHDWH